MTIQDKLKAIASILYLSQEDLADRFDVSFVTVNRWMNGHVLPRPKAEKNIQALYESLTGKTSVELDVVEQKKERLYEKARNAPVQIEHILSFPDIRDQYVLMLTYTSNSIEGSTMTIADTQAVLFHDSALPNRTFLEQLEAKNHQTALLALFDHLLQKKPVTEALILTLHGMLMNGIRPDAGCYRQHGVRIVGANIPTANYLKIPSLMESLSNDLLVCNEDPIKESAAFHARFEQIHPFSDGNGRIGRLLLHAMLLQAHLPPAVILPEVKRSYYHSLNTAQRTGDTSLLEDFFCDAITEGWNIAERKD